MVGELKELRIGLSLHFPHDNPDAPAYEVEPLLAAACEAERRGFDSVWLAEHHFTPGFPPSPLMLGAAIAARTHRVRIGTGIVVAPLYHPVRLVEDVCLLDRLSGGRVILGLGQGYVKREFESYGIPLTERTARFLRVLGLLRVVFEGSRLLPGTEGADALGPEVWPRPVQQPIPIWIGAYSHPAIRRAARWGYPFFIGGPNMPLELIAAKYHCYLREFNECHANIVPLLPFIQSILVTEDPDKTWSLFGESLTSMFRYDMLTWGSVVAYDKDSGYRTVKNEDDILFKNKTEFRRRMLILTPKEVVSALLKVREQIPFNYLIVGSPWGVPRELSQKCVELLIEHVWPDLQAAVTGPKVPGLN